MKGNQTIKWNPREETWSAFKKRRWGIGGKKTAKQRAQQKGFTPRDRHVLPGCFEMGKRR